MPRYSSQPFAFRLSTDPQETFYRDFVLKWISEAQRKTPGASVNEALRSMLFALIDTWHGYARAGQSEPPQDMIVPDDVTRMDTLIAQVQAAVEERLKAWLLTVIQSDEHQSHLRQAYEQYADAGEIDDDVIENLLEVLK